MKKIENIKNNNLLSIEELVACGILNMQDIDKMQEMKKEKQVSEWHKYAIVKRKDGTYQTYVIDKSSKKRRFLVRKTNAELVDALYDWYSFELNNPTIEDCYKEWLEDLNVRPSTLSRYKRVWKKLFEGTKFSHSQIQYLSRKDIEHFILGTKRKYELSKNAYNKFWEILGPIFDVALDRYDTDLGKNIIREKMSRRFKNEGFALAGDQLVAEENQYFDPATELPLIYEFCSSSNNLTDLGIALTLKTGMRPGECAALRKEDIAPNLNYLNIHAIEEKYEVDGKNVYEVYESGSKTLAGTRFIPLPDSVKAVIEKILSISNPCSEWLFSDSSHERYKSAKFQRRLIVICKKLGFSNKSFTDIRHTYASLLDETSLSDKEKASIMGHSTYTVTQIHYLRDIRDNEYKKEKINMIF